MYHRIVEETDWNGVWDRVERVLERGGMDTRMGGVVQERDLDMAILC